jgi:hypothetical protein
MTDRKAYTVPEAARILGVGTDAVRKRVVRGTIESKLIGDRRYVYLPDTGHDEGHDEGHDTASPALVEELRDRVRFLESMLAEERQARTEEQRRHDTLMAQFMQRIPELEASSEPRETRDDRAGMADEERHLWQSATKAVIRTLVFAAWVFVVFGVGLIPLLVPPLPLSLVQSGWGNSWFALFLLPIVFGYLYGTTWAEGVPPPFTQLVSISATTGFGAAIVSIIAIGWLYKEPVGLEDVLLYRILPAFGLFVVTTSSVLATMLIRVAKSPDQQGIRGAVLRFFGLTILSPMIITFFTVVFTLLFTAMFGKGGG